jgi:mannose/fructose/N-acetylgalactosamine-specific phosphotransferase system component IID
MYGIIEILFFLVVVCVAAFISTRISSVVVWAQRIVFFGIVVAPSILSYFTFYRAVSSYQQGGSLLVQDHKMTAAGVESFALSVGISAVIALIATAIYFRVSSHRARRELEGKADV